MRTKACLALLTMAGIAGCRATNVDAGQAASVRDSAGVSIVENHRALWDSATAWRVSDQPITSIGDPSSGDPSHQLTWVRRAVRLANGDVVLLEAKTNELRWFDSTGQHLRTVKLTGGGPGEFDYAPGAMLRLPGDTIVLDNGAGRGIKEVFFSPRGEFVREERLDYGRFVSMGHWGECANPVLPDRSRIVCQAEPGQNEYGGNPPPGHFRAFRRLVRIPWALDARDTLGLDGGVEQYGVDLGGGRTAFVMHPLYSLSFTAAGGSPMQIALATNPDYSIQVWQPAKGLVRIIRRAGARRMPTAADLAVVRSYIAHDNGDRFDPGLVDKLVAAIPAPDSVPAVAGLAFAPGGELLVTREYSVSPVPTTTVDVFSATGQFLGTLQLPQYFAITDVGADYIAGVHRTADDLPTVEVYHLMKPH